VQNLTHYLLAATFGKQNGGRRQVRKDLSGATKFIYGFIRSDAPGGAAGDWADLGACTSLLATAKVGALPATAATLTGAAHATPAAPAPAKIAGAATPAETGKDKLQGRENSRVFRF
jgi:hypothetical protein